MTAIVAVVKVGPKLQPSTKKTKYSKIKTSCKKETQKIIRILLDSGSNGDLMFHEKGTPKRFPYLTRQVPKTWCTLNGDFHAKGKGSLEVIFFEYSNSKAVFLTPDIVDYDKKTWENQFLTS